MGLESFLSRYSSSTQYVQVHLLEPQASRWIFSCSLLVLKSFSQVDSLCILWISSAELWVATIWTETFTCVSSFLAHIYVYEYATNFFVLGLHSGFQECHLVHGPFFCEHDGVMVLWRSVCGIFGHRFQIAKTSSMYLHHMLCFAVSS